MKKMMAIMVSAILAMGLGGCGKENADSITAETEKSKSSESGANVKSAADGKTLVVYYSATGNTANAANIIAEQTNADTFELEPVEAYTDEDLDWTKSDSRVSVEHNNPDERNVKLTAVTVDDWDSYDTVYIGYPIWWGIAAWPVDTFIKGNGFTGKTVIPFATAASSGFGESGELLQEMAGTGDWLEGECFRGSKYEEDIAEWVQSLGL